MSITTYRSCNLCEAICGIQVTHEAGRVISIKGDKEDPFSRGHICPKATALADIYDDSDRLKTPLLKNKSGGFDPISYEQAYDLAAKKLNAIREKFGNDSVAIYLGNPTVHNSGALVFQKFLKQALNTKNQYSATSVDQLPHHLAASQMFGHGLFIPVPDIDHTDYMLILGANPAASNGSLMTAPGVRDRLRNISKRGGKVILIDPRETETAKLTDEHHYIRPGTDVWFLGALLHTIFSEKLTRISELDYLRNVSDLEESVRSFTPKLVSQICGIDAEKIHQLAVDFCSADKAVVYGRMGASTQEHGALCHWLINAINLVTGNLDRRGGQMFNNPAVSLVGRNSTTEEFGRWHTRVSQLPEFEGEFPVSALADEMLTSGDGQVRSLITNAGNPVLSTPNGLKMDRAIQGLDFYLALDIYINETTRHADLIIPSRSGLENDHYDFVFNAIAVRNVAKYSPQAIDPGDELSSDWEVMKELTLRLSDWGWGKRALIKWATHDKLLDLGLKLGPYGSWRKPFQSGLNLKRLKQAPHGIDLGPLQPRLPQALRTPDRKVDAAPELYREAIAKLSVEPVNRLDNDSEFQLIGRRHLRNNNSWLHNSPRLIKGKNRCTLMMHASDADKLGLVDQQMVAVQSKVGEVELPLEITQSIMPGVVSIPHGFGHNRNGSKLSVAEVNPGVSINDLTDDRSVDSISGNAAFSGQVVTVRSASNSKIA